MYTRSYLQLMLFLVNLSAHAQQSQLHEEQQVTMLSTETLCKNLNHLRAEYPITYQILLLHCIDPSHKIPSGYFDNHLKIVKNLQLLSATDSVMPEVQAIMSNVYREYAHLYAARKSDAAPAEMHQIKPASAFTCVAVFFYKIIKNWTSTKKP